MIQKGKVLAAVRGKKKHIHLDMSHCTA